MCTFHTRAFLCAVFFVVLLLHGQSAQAMEDRLRSAPLVDMNRELVSYFQDTVLSNTNARLFVSMGYRVGELAAVMEPMKQLAAYQALMQSAPLADCSDNRDGHDHSECERKRDHIEKEFMVALSGILCEHKRTQANQQIEKHEHAVELFRQATRRQNKSCMVYLVLLLGIGLARCMLFSGSHLR